MKSLKQKFEILPWQTLEQNFTKYKRKLNSGKKIKKSYLMIQQYINNPEITMYHNMI